MIKGIKTLSNSIQINSQLYLYYSFLALYLLFRKKRNYTHTLVLKNLLVRGQLYHNDWIIWKLL